MMVSVTQKGGTGYLANIPNIEIAAKTGTALENMIRSKSSILQKAIFYLLWVFPSKKSSINHPSYTG